MPSIQTIVTSAHALHIWALFSQSHRNPSTYSPLEMDCGIVTRSEMSVLKGSRPLHLPVSDLVRSTTSLHGGGNWGGSAELEYGKGFIAHDELAGQVPSVTNVAAISTEPPSYSSVCVVLAKGRGVFCQNPESRLSDHRNIPSQIR